jgi:hypothetical protein
MCSFSLELYVNCGLKGYFETEILRARLPEDSL